MWQARAQHLSDHVEQLQRALPKPTSQNEAVLEPSATSTVEPTQQASPETSPARPLVAALAANVASARESVKVTDDIQVNVGVQPAGQHAGWLRLFVKNIVKTERAWTAMQLNAECAVVAIVHNQSTRNGAAPALDAALGNDAFGGHQGG